MKAKFYFCNVVIDRESSLSGTHHGIKPESPYYQVTEVTIENQ